MSHLTAGQTLLIVVAVVGVAWISLTRKFEWLRGWVRDTDLELSALARRVNDLEDKHHW